MIKRKYILKKSYSDMPIYMRVYSNDTYLHEYKSNLMKFRPCEYLL